MREFHVCTYQYGEYMHLRDLLIIENVLVRNKALKKAFNAYTEVIDIDGCELDALVILLNLTYSKKFVDDLLDIKIAKKILNDSLHLDKCINEVQWLHTHNLKYPDIRVSLQNLVVASPLLQRSVLSSANYKQSFGWSHDSAQVNRANLFNCYFSWKGEVQSIATILSVSSKEWKTSFQKLGMPVKEYNKICQQVNEYLTKKSIPEKVDRHSPQVRIPYRDGYLAVTPVISNVMQSEIQKAALQRNGEYLKLEFTRPASVSDLISSLGGFVHVFNYPPTTHKGEHGLSQSRLSKLSNGGTVFNLNAIVEKRFINALEGILLKNNALTLKQRRQHKCINVKEVRKALSQWLAPILEWREDIGERPNSLSMLKSCKETLEYQVLAASSEQLLELLPPLFRSLNIMLSNLVKVQKYAFHQQLMDVFKSSLKWLLNSIVKENGQDLHGGDEERNQRYLYLKDIRVFDAQALSNPYCSGIPSLTAVWGMLHRYQRQLNKALETELRFTSFSWFIKSFSYVEGKKLPELGMQGVTKNEFRRPGIIDNKYCDLQFDLVVHIDGWKDDVICLDGNLDLLRSAFPNNLAGGVMLQPELDTVNKWCDLYSDEELLFKQLQRLPLSGRWVMPTNYPINDLNDLLFLLKTNSELSPTMLGFLLLDKPQSRGNSFEPLHCYAEPALGIIEFVSSIYIRLQGPKKYFNKSFWMLDIQERFMLMKRI